LVSVNGSAGTAPIELRGTVGVTLHLDAAGTTDPDGQRLHYRWFVYPEAGLTGTHGAEVVLTGGDTPQATLELRSACRTAWIPGICKGEGVAHVILTVTDEGSPRLTSYRRVILRVEPANRE
jgi:hypothetical protein